MLAPDDPFDVLFRAATGLALYVLRALNLVMASELLAGDFCRAFCSAQKAM